MGVMLESGTSLKRWAEGRKEGMSSWKAAHHSGRYRHCTGEAGAREQSGNWYLVLCVPMGLRDPKQLRWHLVTDTQAPRHPLLGTQTADERSLPSQTENDD